MERLGVVRSHFPVQAQQVAAGEELSMAPKPVLPVRVSCSVVTVHLP